MAGVHGLEHVESLAAAALADDHPVGPHTEGVSDKIADRDLAFSLDVGRATLQPDQMFLFELELDGVLEGDDAFVLGDEVRQDVQQGGLAGARTTRDQDIHLAADTGRQEIDGYRRQGPERDQVTDG